MVSSDPSVNKKFSGEILMTTNEQGTKKTNWLWIGLGAAALFCLCAVVVAVFVINRVGKQVAEGVKDDPESVAKAAHEIVDSYKLPDGYEEKMAMNIMVYSFIMFGPENSTNTDQPIIMLAQFEAGVSQEQMEQQLRQSFEQQMGRRGIKLQLVDVKKATIRGEETEIATYEGTDENGTSVRQVVTAFPGKNGSAMLIIMGEMQGWDEQMVDDFIKSIQ
jgi:hypothetical protein